MMRARLLVAALLVALPAAATGLSLSDPAFVRAACRHPATTNLILQSETFGTTWNQNSNSVSTNAAVAPNGTTTADGFISSTNNGGHQVSQPVTLTATTYTYSVHAKAADKPGLILYNNALSKGWVFNLSTCAAVITWNGQTGISGRAQPYPNGWCRVELTFTGTAASHNMEIYADGAMTGVAGSNVYTGDGTTISTYLWGAQLEARATASPYVPTTTVAVSRSEGPCT